MLEAGVAFEVFASTVVREVRNLRAYDSESTARVLECGFKNIVGDHLSTAAGIDVDLSDVSTPLGHWWRSAYLLRNRVVHQGYKPTQSEAEAALAATADAIGHVAAGLANSADTRGVSALIVGHPLPFSQSTDAELGRCRM